MATRSISLHAALGGGSQGELIPTEYYGDYVDDFDRDAIEAEYREAINTALPDGVTIAGDQVYIDEDAEEFDLSEILDTIDLDEIAQRHDISGRK